MIHCGQFYIEAPVDKETYYIPKPASFPCPDETHPTFTINVTEKRPGICYYCSKKFVVKNESTDKHKNI